VISGESTWESLRNVLLLLLVFAFCLYLPTLSHYSFADDDIYLAYSNKLMRDAPWSEVYRLFFERTNAWEFLPVRDFSYWLDFRLYGDELSGFHLSNLLWYVVSCMGAWWLFRELILFCRPGWYARVSVLSLLGTLIFAIHPAHVEVVAWIASRKDILSSTLVFLALGFLTRGLRHGWLRRELALAAVFLVLACFSKAAAVTSILLIAILICSAWAKTPELNRARASGYLVLFTALIAAVMLVHLNVGLERGIRIENAPGLFEMFERASRILSGLVGILLFPYPLKFYHDVYQFSAWHWWVSGGSILLAGVAAAVFVRSRSLWAFGILLILSPLLIYLQLMPFTTWSLASERFVYPSVAGLGLLFVDLAGRLDRPRMLLAVIPVIVLLAAAIVWTRIEEWELGPRMLALEYERQPQFHNAMRDQIVFTLLPEKRYDDAVALARQVPRPYAADSLLALVDAERAYREMSEAVDLAKNGSGNLQQRFCVAVSHLRAATRAGYRSISDETDVSYNNILRTLDQRLYWRFGDSDRLCPATTGGGHSGIKSK
jgi:hypothetical protein